ncbi:DsbE family thiol:disulfide interchange protein [Natronospirillum operosum]|uniref:DsbE family thiol:disulfide interchange protein n=1 Tax=Natronospirillum operosum TaxID=2759953 RepID=A0A4Z0W9T0_9GAMM|nr:DsbE family thiol:disulfide interchange protein [Natronospirillum operosum]TGG95369.1 DsbE family thiol:disulfide interchange protein [Natronospirillum operosum]
MRWVVFVPFFVVMVAATVFGYMLSNNEQEGSAPSTRIGQPLPAFALEDLVDPELQRVNEDMLGEPFLLNVWGSWCPSCRIEHPVLNGLAADGVRIIGLNYRDTRDGGIEWLEERGDPYVFNVFDPIGEFGFDLGVVGAPETYFVDAEGIVRHRHVGILNERHWENTLRDVWESL